MNSISQITRKTATVLAMLLLAVACTKESGEVGPKGDTGAQGSAGPQGPTGSAGPQGQTGNANVMQISFGEKTHSGSELTYTLTGVTQAQLNGSAYFTYVRPNSYWYSLPGTTSGGSREYRTYVDASTGSTPRLMISRVAGSGSEVFNTTRVVIIPANTLTNARQAAIDFNDYNAVKKAFNLTD
ncbi:MAG: collagen-like protein [Sphingobacteriaceae bacterium]|nr:collagen-like protein [Cytophagaceae bacterium]